MVAIAVDEEDRRRRARLGAGGKDRGGGEGGARRKDLAACRHGVFSRGVRLAEAEAASTRPSGRFPVDARPADRHIIGAEQFFESFQSARP